MKISPKGTEQDYLAVAEVLKRSPVEKIIKYLKEVDKDYVEPLENENKQLEEVIKALSEYCYKSMNCRYLAISKQPDECKKILKMEFPVLQVIDTNRLLEKIGKQDYDSKLVSDGLNRLRQLITNK